MTTRIALDFDTLDPAVADKLASALVAFVNAQHPLSGRMLHGTVVTYDGNIEYESPEPLCNHNCDPMTTKEIEHYLDCPVFTGKPVRNV